jgi:hypothetical protein
VFRRLDYQLWERTAHNPVQMLRLIAPETLARAERDPAFLAAYDTALSLFDPMRAAPAAGRTWWQTAVGAPGLE